MSKQGYKTTVQGPTYGVVTGERNTVIINLPGGTQQIIPVDASFFTVTATRSEHFVGRQKELDYLKASLLSTDAQAVSITALHGMGGVGKTTLATEIIYELAEHFPGGILWADFPSHQGNPLPILASWAQLCGRPELIDLPSEEIRAQAVKRAVETHIKKSGKMLAVFDDIRETNEDAWIEGAHLLRKAIPDGTPVIITTRQANVAASLRAHHILSLDILESEDAIKLISHFVPDINSELAIELVKLTGNLPLAIEIAAALIRIDGLDWVVESLRDPRSRIEVLDLGGVDRKEDSIRLSFSLSYQSLSLPLAELFCLLGVFSQGYIAPEWVTGLIRHYGSDTIPQNNRIISGYLHDLANRSLLKRTKKGYRFHPLLRDYARQLLSKREKEYARATLAHSRQFLNMVIQTEVTVPAFGLALENIMQATDYVYEQEYWLDVIQFVQNLALVGRFLHINGRWQDALDQLNKGVEACKHVDDLKNQTIFLCEIGIHQRELGQYEEAEATFECAAELSRQLENDCIFADVLFNSGYVQLYCSHYEEAVRLLEEAIILAKRTKNQNALGEAIRGLGRVKLSQGDIEAAQDHLHRSNLVLQATNNQQGLTYNLRALGETYAIQKNYKTALAYFEQAMQIANQTEDLQAKAYILRGFGDTYRQQERHEEALDAYLQSEQIYRDIGDRAALAGALCCAGEIYLLLGDIETAYNYFSEGSNVADTVGVTRWQARNLFGKAQVENLRNNKNLAKRLAEEAIMNLERVRHRDASLIQAWLTDQETA